MRHRFGRGEYSFAMMEAKLETYRNYFLSFKCKNEENDKTRKTTKENFETFLYTSFSPSI